MEYFKNFKNRITPQKTQPSHAEQLAKFRKCWAYVQDATEVNAENSKDKKLPPPEAHVSQTEIPQSLKTMVDLLVDEGLRLEDVNTGVCMEELLKNKILSCLVDLAEADKPQGIRGEVIRTIASMINLLDDRFLVHNAVHQPTIYLLRICVHHEPQSEGYHEDLVDLMYIICSKIHGFPDLLNIFFHDIHLLNNPQKALKNSPIDQTIISSSSNQDGNPDDSSSIASSSTLTAAKTTEFTEEPEESEKPEYEFLLFTYLLQFVHREGKSGDFARTGLLFIIELAKDQLGEFIYESDFATIMPSGLGALYSQLPRKLMVKGSSGGLTNATLLGFGDNTSAELDRLRSGGIEVSSSPQFISQLDSFLKLLEFCQDVLNRCPNTEISLALLQNIKTLFLENILYPSIMECSDIDGSAVAVISYIDIILQTLEQEELVDVVVGFLMDSDSDDEDFWKKKKSRMQKRQSTINLNLFAGVEASPITSSPYFTATGRFTLKDLILSRLKSSSQQIVVATLKLLHTVISKHCRYSLKLLNIELDENATCFPKPNYLDETHDHEILGSTSFTPAPKLTTISHHLKELDLFFSLISTADRMKIFANGYECYVHDAEAITEADLCYRNGQEVEWTEDGPTKPKGSKNNRKPILAYSERKNGEKDSAKGISCVPKHRLIPTDKHNPNESLLQILIGILSNFFAHSPELNLALTGVISALAICPYRSLEGWLVFSGTDRVDKVDRRDSSVFESLHADAKNLEISPSVPNHDLHVPSEDDDDKPVNEFDDSDDRSVDYNADQSPSAAKAIGATHGWKNFPPFFTIFKTLTQQVDYYRNEVQNFDQILEVRRNGLLDSEDEIDENFFRQPSSSVVPIRSRRSSNATLPSSGSSLSTSPSNKTRKLSSATHHGRSPKRSNSLVQGDSSSSNLPPLRSSSVSSNLFTPLSTHFRETEGIKIQPLFPAHFVNEDEEEEPTDIGDEEGEEMFDSKKQTRTKNKESKPKEITLSSLLNNVVILEEAVKELVAIVQVRRSLGIDEVRYL